jgi:CHAT domain-containing protein
MAATIYWRLLCLVGAALSMAGPGSAQVQLPPSPPALPNEPPVALTSEDMAKADALFAQALPFIVRGEWEKSYPLLEQATLIYDRAWGGVAVGSATQNRWEAASQLKTAGLEAMKAGRFDAAERRLRHAAALYFLRKQMMSGNEFDSWGADYLVQLGLALYEGGKAREAEALFGLLANVPNGGAQEGALNQLVSETYMLMQAGKLDEAERLARFALRSFDHPASKAKAGIPDMKAMLAQVLTVRGDASGAAELVGRTEVVKNADDHGSAERAASVRIANLVAAGELAEARAQMARLTGGSPTDFGLQGAKKLVELAGAFGWVNFTPAVRIALLREALSTYERLLPRDDDRIHETMTNLAGQLASIGKPAEAEPLLRRALLITEKKFGLDSGYASDNMTSLASVLVQLARPAEAEALYRRNWAIAAGYNDYQNDATQEALGDLVQVLVQQQKLAEADQLSREGLAKAEQAKGISPETMSRYLFSRGQVLAALGRKAEAEEVFRAAHQRHSDVFTQSAYAIALEGAGKFAAAEPLRRKLLEAVTQNVTLGAYSEIRISAAVSLAANLSRQGKTSDADALLAEMAKLSRDVFGPQSGPAADAADSYALHLLRSGRGQAAVEPARAALAARVAARDRIDPSAGDAQQFALGGEQRDSARLFARTLWAGSGASQAGPLAELFEALQRTDNSAAADALARGAARQAAAAAGAGPALATWRGAQDRVAAVDAAIAELAEQGAKGDSARVALYSQRDAAARALSAAQAALARQYPRFFDLVRSQPLPLSQLQGRDGLLRPDEALILLYPGSDALPEGQRRGLVFVVTREATAVAEIPLDPADLSKAVATLHGQLAHGGETAAPDLEPPAVNYDRRLALSLYRSLFADPRVAQLLSTRQRWTLAPQGVLLSLPFSALVTADPPGGETGDTDPDALRRTAWLGLERTLALVPSVASIAIQRRSPAQGTAAAAKPFFGLGDPAFRGVPDPPLPPAQTGQRGAARSAPTLPPVQSLFRGAAADASAIARLPRLGGTAAEVRLLAERFGAGRDAVVLQLDATEAELRRRDKAGQLGQVAVIAFATHGLLAGELDAGLAEPALALTPPTGNGAVSSEDDGLLTASEAAGLKLSARWVILSACNTAGGGKPDAESLSGLARAFFYAGARSLLVSHYPVYDDAAPQLTGEAVRIASEDKVDTAEALRRSMVLLAKDTSKDMTGVSFAHPKAWAPFALVGAD